MDKQQQIEKMSEDLGIGFEDADDIPVWFYKLMARLIDAGWHK